MQESRILNFNPSGGIPVLSHAAVQSFLISLTLNSPQYVFLRLHPPLSYPGAASSLMGFNFWRGTRRRGGSAVDGRTTRHAGYAISQKKRNRIEACFGWLKTIALLRKLRHRGTLKVDWDFLSRLRRLQSGAHAKLEGCYRSGAVSPGRSVSKECENTHREHPAARKIAAKLTWYSEMTQRREKSARATNFFSGLLRWHNFLGPSFRFYKSVFASSSRTRGLGKGTAFESRPQQPFRNLFLVFFIHKSLYRFFTRFTSVKAHVLPWPS